MGLACPKQASYSHLALNSKACRVYKTHSSELKKLHACLFLGLHDHYSELLTWMAVLKFVSTVPKPTKHLLLSSL